MVVDLRKNVEFNQISMMQQSSKFVSYIESRIEENNTLYGHFQLGTFAAGQALTIANALRRTLLSEIPAFLITSVQIEGGDVYSDQIPFKFDDVLGTDVPQLEGNSFGESREVPKTLKEQNQNLDEDIKSMNAHEFASLPGIQESVLNILLNLKRLVLVPTNLNIFDPQIRQFSATLHVRGPRIITAKDINFPSELAPVIPSHYIATLSATGELKLLLTIQFKDPLDDKTSQLKPLLSNPQEIIVTEQPKPITQVNFGIHQFPLQPQEEYISLEIWTNGSITPQAALEFSLENLTKIFYEFTKSHKNL